ncbi:MAG: hypothetical protein QM804_16340 [Propionicimonas sp.]
MARTILPFLAIYAAFGFVDDYARNVMLALQGRFSFSAIEFINQLDPTKSTTTLAIVAGVVVALYLARRVLDRLAARRDHAWITLLGALVEASWVLLALLSLFRIVEVVKLWLNSRQLAAWGFELFELLFGWIRLTGFWLDAWEFLARQAWPAFWDVLTQPLAWLALAAVVAGIKVVTSAELLQESAGEPRRQASPKWPMASSPATWTTSSRRSGKPAGSWRERDCPCWVATFSPSPPSTCSVT